MIPNREERLKMGKKQCLKIAEAIQNSNYHVAALGWRNVGLDELASIIKLITEEKTGDIANKLNMLYKHHPDTIALNRAEQERYKDVPLEDLY